MKKIQIIFLLLSLSLAGFGQVTGEAWNYINYSTKIFNNGSSINVPLPEYDYYFSVDGSDDDDGLTRATAKQSIDGTGGFNDLNLTAGQSVAFRQGDTWSGAGMIIGNSGADGNPITITSYSDTEVQGASPVISGFSQVTAWTNKGGNIWESTNAVSTLDYLNIVLVNGRNTPMGRTPNVDEVYNVDAYVSGSYIEASELTGTPDYTGGQVVIRKVIYAWSTCGIASQATNRLYYTEISDNIAMGLPDCGFFIQSHPSTLDVQNEWYYNPTTKKLQIYSSSEPIGVSVPTIETLVDGNGQDYITINNIEFEGSNANTVTFGKGSTDTYNIIVDNCEFYNIGRYAIFYENMVNSTISDNVFQHCNSAAVSDASTSNRSENTQVIDNIIDSTYMIIGVGGYPPGAISVVGSALVQYNSITNTGKEGIKWNGATTQIRNNFIDSCLHFCSDGAGIYAYNSSGVDAIVDGNIVLNAFGYGLGTSDNNTTARGVYMDSWSKYTTISNNTTAYTSSGINISNNSRHLRVEDNTSFNNRVASLRFNNRTVGYSDEDSLFDITVINNKFFAMDELCLQAMSTYSDVATFIDTAYNNIYSRPLFEDGTTMYVYENTGTQDYFTVDTWQTWSGVDSLSSSSVPQIRTEDDISFVYNATKSETTPILGEGIWLLSDGTEFSGILQPYSSEVLFRQTAKDSIGNTTIYAPTTSTAGTLRGYPVTMTEDGYIYSIVAYHDTHATSEKLLTGLYSDNSSTPDALIGQSQIRGTLIDNSEGWQEIKLATPVFVASGTTVWVSWNKSGAVSTLRYEAGLVTRATTSSTFATNLPSTFPSPSYANYSYSIYVKYATE